MLLSQLAKSGSEYSHQTAFFARCALNLKRYPMLKWIHSITNEEKTNSAIVGGRARAAGRRAGVSDISFPYKSGSFCGLYIELKKMPGKGVGPSKEQLEFGEFVQSQGFMFAVCYGHEDAWNCLEYYLKLEKEN